MSAYRTKRYEFWNCYNLFMKIIIYSLIDDYTFRNFEPFPNLIRKITMLWYAALR